MNWNEAIAAIDWQNERTKSWVDLEKLSSVLNLSVYGWYEEVEQRMQKIWLKSWMCTDTEVGAAAYFLDGKLVCISWQPARKSYEEFEFISKESAKSVVDFILSLEDNTDGVKIADLNEELPTY